MISPNDFNFDAVIAALERGKTPDGVDTFDMSTFVMKDTWRGLAADLYGSAALAAGYSIESARDAFYEWRPDNPRMAAIQRLCDMPALTTAQVIAMYRGIASDGTFVMRGSYVLRRANLIDADLRGADLCGADLCRSCLYRADLRDADLTDANLRSANLIGANLSGANLSGANLRYANLRSANLTGANLRGANLTDANLTGANLRGANLRYANLIDADLRGANLTDAAYDKYTRVPKGFDPDAAGMILFD